ncbi:MAG: hypothetical protein QM703_08375 [Gemmatales bacterium]
MIDRQRIRLASWLQHLWQPQHRTLHEASYEWELLASRWESLRLALYRCQLADKHGLLLCQPELKQDLQRALRNLAQQTSTLDDFYEVVHHEDLTFRHWFEEVEQLYAEFNGVTFQPEEGKLRVETPIITLGDICLGAFAIDFRKKSTSISIHDFQIVALQPEPANTEPSVFHPHVKDGELCAGDAKVPIRLALESGRLTDAYLMILSTLQTYNSRSAYVQLSQWQGIPCFDCSRTINPDDSFTCESCQHSLCDQCFSSCSSCSSTYCPECIKGCSSCKSSSCEACLEPSERDDKPLCRNCRTSCGRCGQIVAVEEIDEDEQVCLDCVDQDEEVLQTINPEETITT